MDRLSFAHVPPEGIIGFSQMLARDEWATFNTAPMVGPDGAIIAALLDAPTGVFLKLRLQWAIEMLANIREGAGSAKSLDHDWDSVQDRLEKLLDAAAVHPDPQIRAAAIRLRALLLLGAGKAQTRLKYQQEVDFGRQQVNLTSAGQGAADIALLGLGPIMDEVRQTTEALAAAIGHGQSSKPPSKQLQSALVECRAIFEGVAWELGWVVDRGTTDVNRARAARLREPLEALADRYPAPSTPTPPPADEEPKPPTGGASTPPTGPSVPAV